MTTQQFDMFGPPTEALGDLTPLQKAEFLMDENEQARSDDRLLMLLWWERFDDLGPMFHWMMRDLLPDGTGDEALQQAAEKAMTRFMAWFENAATHPETIRRRRAELQANRKKHGTLRATPEVTAYRKARDSAGPPRR